MRTIGKCLRIIGLFVLFTIGCWMAPILTLFFRFATPNSYWRRFVYAADKMMAAMFGFSGRFTLSAECAYAERKTFKILHDMLNDIQPEHCEKAALHESMYCRISDHTFGDK